MHLGQGPLRLKCRYSRPHVHLPRAGQMPGGQDGMAPVWLSFGKHFQIGHNGRIRIGRGECHAAAPRRRIRPLAPQQRWVGCGSSLFSWAIQKSRICGEGVRPYETLLAGDPHARISNPVRSQKGQSLGRAANRPRAAAESGILLLSRYNSWDETTNEKTLTPDSVSSAVCRDP
jgi:hypothetical protein